MNKSITTKQMRILIVSLFLLFFSSLLVRASAADLKLADTDFRNLIENNILPIMQRNPSSFLAEEDWKEIVAIMEKSGRSLPETVASVPSHSKDGLLRALISSELGGTLGEWRVEEQAWYADMIVSLGLSDTSELRIPQEGEITQEQAVQLAVDYLRQVLDSDIHFEDQEKFLCTAQYVADSTWRARWYIEFSNRNPNDDIWFQVQISPYGDVDEKNSSPNEFYSAPVTPDATEQQSYLTETSITQGDAIELAWSAVKEKYELDDTSRELYEVSCNLATAGSRPVWKVTFWHSEENLYSIRVDAQTGNILDVYDASDRVG